MSDQFDNDYDGPPINFDEVPPDEPDWEPPDVDIQADEPAGVPGLDYPYIAPGADPNRDSLGPSLAEAAIGGFGRDTERVQAMGYCVHELEKDKPFWNLDR